MAVSAAVYSPANPYSCSLVVTPPVQTMPTNVSVQGYAWRLAPSKLLINYSNIRITELIKTHNGYKSHRTAIQARQDYMIDARG